MCMRVSMISIVYVKIGFTLLVVIPFSNNITVYDLFCNGVWLAFTSYAYPLIRDKKVFHTFYQRGFKKVAFETYIPYVAISHFRFFRGDWFVGVFATLLSVARRNVWLRFVSAAWFIGITHRISSFHNNFNA